MAKRKRDKIADALAERGCIEVESRSRKYKQFMIPGRDNFYFVGKSGALRVGKTISNSISLTHVTEKIFNI